MKECEASATPEFRWKINQESVTEGFDVLRKRGCLGFLLKFSNFAVLFIGIK